MTRAADLGITIGLLPSGPTGSIVDVPGVGVGHATVWRDEPPPPEARGVARTGVTVVDLGGNLFRSPVPAGGAAEAATTVRAVRLLAAEGPHPDALAHAGPAITEACAACHQVTGAIGFTLEHPLPHHSQCAIALTTWNDALLDGLLAVG
jgi:hypothetical protein